MLQKFYSKQVLDAQGAPAGGVTHSTGLTIVWQDGPLGKSNTPERKEPNGAFVETVIAAAKDRIEFYQGTKFASVENVEALGYLSQALESLQRRTKAREAQGVEGTHSTHTPVAA